MDYISTAHKGEFDKPTFLSILVKTGVESTPNGWWVNYANTVKVVMLNDDATKPGKKGGKEGKCQEIPAHHNLDTYSDFSEGDFDGVEHCNWDVSSVESAAECEDSDDARRMRKVVECKEDVRKDVSAKLLNYIDISRYVIYTNAKNGHITVRWRESEKRKHRLTYREAVKAISLLPYAKTMHASRTSKISKHGVSECVKRAQEWQNWHADVLSFYLLSCYHFGPLRPT